MPKTQACYYSHLPPDGEGRGNAAPITEMWLPRACAALTSFACNLLAHRRCPLVHWLSLPTLPQPTMPTAVSLVTVVMLRRDSCTLTNVFTAFTSLPVSMTPVRVVLGYGAFCGRKKIYENEKKLLMGCVIKDNTNVFMSSSKLESWVYICRYTFRYLPKLILKVLKSNKAVDNIYLASTIVKMGSF